MKPQVLRSQNITPNFHTQTENPIPSFTLTMLYMAPINPINKSIHAIIKN